MRRNTSSDMDYNENRRRSSAPLLIAMGVLLVLLVVIIGLLVVAVNAFFPTFFTDMFEGMKTRLNGHW